MLRQLLALGIKLLTNLLGCLISENKASTGCEVHADTLNEARLDVRDLNSGFSAKLAYRLLNREHPIHASMRVREPSAIRIGRKAASRPCVAFRNEAGGFSMSDETQILKAIQRKMRECVVDH